MFTSCHLKFITSFTLHAYLLLIILFSCTSSEEKQREQAFGEALRLAKLYCTACHAEAPPGLLDKMTWVYKIMPQMGPRLEIFNTKSYTMSQSDINAQNSSLTTGAM